MKDGEQLTLPLVEADEVLASKKVAFITDEIKRLIGIIEEKSEIINEASDRDVDFRSSQTNQAKRVRYECIQQLLRLLPEVGIEIINQRDAFGIVDDQSRLDDQYFDKLELIVDAHVQKVMNQRYS